MLSRSTGDGARPLIAELESLGIDFLEVQRLIYEKVDYRVATPSLIKRFPLMTEERVKVQAPDIGFAEYFVIAADCRTIGGPRWTSYAPKRARSHPTCREYLQRRNLRRAWHATRSRPPSTYRR